MSEVSAGDVKVSLKLLQIQIAVLKNKEEFVYVLIPVKYKVPRINVRDV